MTSLLPPPVSTVSPVTAIGERSAEVLDVVAMVVVVSGAVVVVEGDREVDDVVVAVALDGLVVPEVVAVLDVGSLDDEHAPKTRTAVTVVTHRVACLSGVPME
jgi:hypothetical protein